MTELVKNMENSIFEIQDILRKFYGLLEGKTADQENVAGILQQYFPERNCHKICSDLWEGIKTGEKDFERWKKMNSSELYDLIPKELNKRMLSVSQEERKQYLLLLINYIYSSYGQTIHQANAIRLAEMEEKDLLNEVSYLIGEKGAIIAGQSAEFLKDTVMPYDISKSVKEHSHDENKLILASAMYVSANQKKEAEEIQNLTDSLSIGKQTGFEMSMWQEIKEGFQIFLEGMAIAAMIFSVSVALEIFVPVLFEAVKGGAGIVIKYIIEKDLEGLVITLTSAASLIAIGAITDRIQDDYIEPVIENGECSVAETNEYFDKVQIPSVTADSSLDSYKVADYGKENAIYENVYDNYRYEIDQ